MKGTRRKTRSMNRRKLKKSLKKAQAAALQNLNEHLKRENVKLKREVSEVREGLDEVKESSIKNIVAIARIYGEKIDGHCILKLPIEGAHVRPEEYDCFIENGVLVVSVLPKVDPEG